MMPSHSTVKELTYRVVGPSGIMANVTYFDVRSEQQRADGVRLPWSVGIDYEPADGHGKHCGTGTAE